MLKIHKPFVDLINSFSYDFYIIQPYDQIYCTCLNHATMQGDPACKKCLGTGRKIKIKKIKGASEETKFIPTVRNDSGFQVSKIFYLNKDYDFKDNNIIVDKDQCFNVYRIKENTGLKHEVVYYSLFCYKKKNNPTILMDNFYDLINKKR